MSRQKRIEEGGQTRLWQRFLLAAMVGMTAGLRRLPRRTALDFGAGLGRLAYRVAKRQRFYADRNLRLVFGDAMSASERADLTRRVFINFGKTAVDFLRGGAQGKEQALSVVARVEGWEEYAVPALAAGRGLIILTAHLGNWELLGPWIPAQGVLFTAVAREPEDAAFAAYVRRIRESAGFTVLNKGASARGLLNKLRQGEAICILPDQNSGDVFVPFFGVPAGTTAGPASLALHTGATLLPSYCVREREDSYRMLFLPPIPTEPTGDREADVARVMTEANRVLEGVIRQYPDQWLWLHNRWKSAFEEKNLSRWPKGFDLESLRARWED